MERIIECVPNFSEGRNRAVIDAIVAAIAGAGGKVLHVDAGEGANRTVVTFVGSPEEVVEAAFQGAKKATELIDMRLHHGTHPRCGACDVLPLVPVSGVSLDECVTLARGLARRIYEETGMPCYCYEAAALRPSMTALSACRAGEWEALPERIADPLRRPDFGPMSFNDVVARTGACCVGARKFMIAVNFNLASTSVPLASEIAAELRESGRVLRDASGKVLRDSSGKALRLSGRFKHLKAIGWYIEEYGIAQVSMNVYDIAAAPLHEVFEAVCLEASKRGVKVTGTEIIGLVPKSVLLDAGRYYLSHESSGSAQYFHPIPPSVQCCDPDEGGLFGQSILGQNSMRDPFGPSSKSSSLSPNALHDSFGVGLPEQSTNEQSLIAAAIEGLGLDDLRPFDPQLKVLEYIVDGAN